ncbi:hypothetical protein [Marilutibacter maris]|uniref:hypothetical protein n=1 Tax=Marilutibacter maris TaxID=1605891 RepID=UPI0011AE7184|nr:hypothetical protein [Lysobacter maris]
MDSKIPFTSYDFWAYLSAGFLLLFVGDYVIGTHVFSRTSWTLVQGVVAVSAAYAVGQLVASASAWMFERGLVGLWLGYPRNVLFGNARASRWLRRALPGYFHALPDETRRAALARARAAGIDDAGEALFWAAYGHARSSPVVMGRLDNFLNLYGFCRNTALVAFLDAGLLVAHYQWGGGSSKDVYFAGVAIVAGAGLLLRYLKFFRHFAVELFTAYAVADGSAPR